MPRLKFINYVIGLFMIAAFVAVSYSQEPVERLAVGASIERQIKGGESHRFILELSPGQTGRVDVEQKGIDISLAATTPSGERYIETESPSGVLGRDHILVTSIDAGTYTVIATPADPRAAVGKYSIRLTEIRPTIDSDRAINTAAKRITKVADEATVLRQNGTREGRRAAIDKFAEVIDLSRQKQDKIWEVVALITTGLLYEQLGEIQRSLDYYSRGLTLAREVGSRQYEGSAINNLAVGYLTLAEYENAVSYLTQALQIQTETGNRRGQGVVYNNLGTANLMLNELPRAEAFYQKALEIRREVKDDRGEGFALNNLGQVYLESGEYKKAREYFDQALDLRRRISDKQGEGVTTRNIAKLLFKTGQFDDAKASFLRANEISGQIGDRRVQADTFYWLASIESRSRRLDAAIKYIESGLGIIEQIRGEIINPQLKTGYFSTVPQFYELYVLILVQRGEANNDQSDIDLSFQVSERARARTLVELLQEARIDIEKGPDAKLLDELQESLNAKYRERTTLLSGKFTPEQDAKLTAELNKLVVDVENLQVKIRREDPRYADIALGSVRSSTEIRELLDDKTVILEYKLGDERSFLWMVTREKITVHKLPPRREIEALAAANYRSLSSKNADPKFPTLLKELNGILLGPVASSIGNSRLVIVADGILQFLPFASLGSASDSEIVTLPSAAVLAELRDERVKEKKASQKVVIFADPVFEANDSRLTARRQTAESTAKRSNETPNVIGGNELPRLLSSRREARAIQTLSKADTSTVLLDFEASRKKLQEVALTEYSYVHFATHGILNPKDPGSSGLAFSMFESDGRRADGLLRLGNIYDLKLDSELVVLSACQTALGKDVRGEGIIGLTRGFMYAGSKRVLASLWKVDDAATAEFMKRFYTALFRKGLSPAKALLQAQNEMKAIPRFRSPFYWAAFSLQGDWR